MFLANLQVHLTCNCVWVFLAYGWTFLLPTVEAFLLTIELHFLQTASASNKHLIRL